jgi:hypothetical protein
LSEEQTFGTLSWLPGVASDSSLGALWKAGPDVELLRA